MGAEAGGGTGSRGPPLRHGGKTGTTATLVQLERVPRVRDGDGREGSPQLPWGQTQASGFPRERARGRSYVTCHPLPSQMQ